MSRPRKTAAPAANMENAESAAVVETVETPTEEKAAGTEETAVEKTEETASEAAPAAEQEAPIAEAAPVKKPRGRRAKAAEKKEEAPAEKKKPGRKPGSAAKTVKTAICVQFAGKEYTEKALVAAVKKSYTALGNKASDIKTIDLYVKTDENVVYYVVNGVGADEYKIIL